MAASTGGQQKTEVGSGDQTIWTQGASLPGIPGKDKPELALSGEHTTATACTAAGTDESRSHVLDHENAPATRGFHQPGSPRQRAGGLNQAGSAEHSALHAPGSQGLEGVRNGLTRKDPAAPNGSTGMPDSRAPAAPADSQTVSATQEGRAPLIKAGWLAEDGWVYQRWNRKERKLVVDQDRQPMSHDNAVRTLNALKQGLTGDVIQRFKATQGLEEIEASGQQSATFLLQVSLRGTTAAEVHEGLLSLAQNAMTHLVGISIKRQSPARSQLANHLHPSSFPPLGSLIQIASATLTPSCMPYGK